MLQMRTQEQMFELILGYAKEDPRIVAVYMNGSRCNPNVKKDIFQDYDIVYVVEEVKPFREDKNFPHIFGEMLVMQEPDCNVLYDDVEDIDHRYGYLMQFMDGNRIDLTLISKEKAQSTYLDDKLTLALLDKIGILPVIGEPTDIDYHVKKPTEEMYFNCCNEFWWVTPYIGKGLWRGEITYAMDHLNHYVRPMALKMLEWYVGTQTDFSLSVGKNHKYLQKYISEELWSKLLDTYPRAKTEEIWEAVFTLGELFGEVAREVADKLGYQYNEEEEQKTTDYMKDISILPKDAKKIR